MFYELLKTPMVVSWSPSMAGRRQYGFFRLKGGGNHGKGL
jgi:hypothetical protein